MSYLVSQMKLKKLLMLAWDESCDYEITDIVLSLSICFRKNTLQPRVEQTVNLPQLTLECSKSEVMFAAYIASSWTQAVPCTNKFLGLSLMNDTLAKNSGNWSSDYFTNYLQRLRINSDAFQWLVNFLDKGMDCVDELSSVIIKICCILAVTGFNTFGDRQ